MGVAHRSLNTAVDECTGRARGKHQWSIWHEQAYFNPEAPWCYRGEAAPEVVLADIERSVNALSEHANDAAFQSYYEDTDPIRAALFAEHAIVHAAITGDAETAATRLGAWRDARQEQRADHQAFIDRVNNLLV